MKKSPFAKWIRSFFCTVLAILLVLSAAVYAVDPFMQFRTRDNAYMLYPLYVSGGLVKNYEYDTLIIGSSMTQNFNMDTFRTELGDAPLHIGLGGMLPVEITQVLSAAYEAGKADTYYIGIDLMVFENEAAESRFPSYLFNDTLWAKLRYFLSYEVWFRYLPVDLGFVALDLLGIRLPESYTEKQSIDKLGDWSSDFPVWGEQVVLENYTSEQYGVSHTDSTGLLERTVANIDKFFASCDFSQGEHIFFFPPYSSLCWCEYENRGQLEIHLQAKDHFIEKAREHGVVVYDFQSAEFTTDLSNYKDTTHYMPHINDWMVQCFANGEYVVTEENAAQFRQILLDNTQSFRSAYAWLFS